MSQEVFRMESAGGAREEVIAGYRLEPNTLGVRSLGSYSVCKGWRALVFFKQEKKHEGR